MFGRHDIRRALLRQARRAGVAALCLGATPSAFAADGAGPGTPESQSATSTADAVALAERHAAEAYSAYQEQRYADAVALYQKAYEVLPSADILYNIARIYDSGLHDRPLAITFYRRYVADPGASAERIRKANQRLAELKAAEAAAIPGPAPAPEAPLGSNASSAQAGPASSSPSGWSVAALVMGGAGVVALGVGAGFGLSARSEADTVHELCDGNRCTDPSGVEAVDSARSYATMATTGFIVGGALVAAGATILLIDPGGDPEADSLSALRLAPRASESELGFSLQGSF